MPELSTLLNVADGVAGLDANAALTSPVAGSVRLLTFIPAAEHAAIFAGTSTYDCSAALSAAIASATTSGGWVFPTAGIIDLPRGQIYFAAGIELRASVHLRGHGCGQAGGNFGTVMKFPANSRGITIKKGTPPSTNGGDGTLIEGVYIRGSGGTNPDGNGVTMEGRAKLRDCFVSHFSGHGICISADISVNTNANGWLLDSCSSQNNGRSGLYTKGGDANAGCAIGCDFSSNADWGVDDSSFLGNTYTGCHADGNGRRSMVYHLGNRYYVLDADLAGTTEPGINAAVWALIGEGVLWPPYYPQWVSGTAYVRGGAYQSAGASARNVFIGCYSESGTQPPSYYTNRLAIIIGGLHAAGTDGFPSFFVDGLITRVSTQTTAAGQYVEFGMGAGGDQSATFAICDPEGFPYRLQYDPGQHRLSWGNQTQHLALYNRAGTPANGFARDLSAATGGIGFPSGYYLGAKALIKVTPGTAAPTTGTHNRGDQVINTAPAAGGFAGWICTTAGTPGTWKTFGAILA